ncbi:MAG: phosphate/phosphite/phosphonate ABC transporter substrate-binding protein [Myxococcaceae bacterium]|nr:phosphate/phosphite/phosphonate ABC transporter substrate-binding protein [Myxococcaceae bacterium]
MHRLVACLLVALSALAVAGEPKSPPPPKKPLTFGMAHQYGEEHAQKAKALIEPYLTKSLGSQVTVQPFDTYEELSEALATNKVDLAWITPLAFVQATQKNRDVTALSKAMRSSDGGLFYRSVFIVKASSTASDLKSLAGKKVAWVGKLSASGYLFPRALLGEQGLDPDRHFGAETFAGDHLAVCKAVKEGRAEVGATYAAEPKDGAALAPTGCEDAGPLSDFKVLASTANLPNEVIAHSPDFPPTRVNDVMMAFGRMGNTPDGKKVLTDGFRAQGFGVAVEGDFDPVLALLKTKEVKAKVAEEPKAEPAKGKKKGK